MKQVSQLGATLQPSRYIIISIFTRHPGKPQSQFDARISILIFFDMQSQIEMDLSESDEPIRSTAGGN